MPLCCHGYDKGFAAQLPRGLWAFMRFMNHDTGWLSAPIPRGLWSCMRK